MVLLKSPYHLCLATLLPILLAAPLVTAPSGRATDSKMIVQVGSICN